MRKNKQCVIIKMNLQMFGGRGASTMTAGGSGEVKNIRKTESLLSMSGSETEIFQTMAAVKSVSDEYGIILDDIQVATIGGKSRVMAYFDSSGNLAINKSYFDSKKASDAYDNTVKQGFHPARGNKSGLEALAAHEMGHRLTQAAGKTDDFNKLNNHASSIIGEAARNSGYRDIHTFRKSISRYAEKNDAEAVAEAFSDVHCNGKSAKKESRAVVDVLNNKLRGGEHNGS